jgi:ribosomal protein S18 acetylase RimI-like enzyme
LRLEALRQSPQSFLGSYQEEAGYAEDDWRKTFEDASWHGFFIAGANPDALNAAGIAKSRVLSQYPGERYIESFWVRPRYRRRQVASRMLNSIIGEARDEGRRVIRLSVLRINTEAISAFRGMGLVAEVPARSSEFEICLELRID